MHDVYLEAVCGVPHLGEILHLALFCSHALKVIVVRGQLGGVLLFFLAGFEDFSDCLCHFVEWFDFKINLILL